MELVRRYEDVQLEGLCLLALDKNLIIYTHHMNGTTVDLGAPQIVYGKLSRGLWRIGDLYHFAGYLCM